MADGICRTISGTNSGTISGTGSQPNAEPALHLALKIAHSLLPSPKTHKHPSLPHCLSQHLYLCLSPTHFLEREIAHSLSAPLNSTPSTLHAEPHTLNPLVPLTPSQTMSLYLSRTRFLANTLIECWVQGVAWMAEGVCMRSV